MQLSGVPNMAFAFGYTNQSWTLGADLTCEQVCRLLDAHGPRGYTTARRGNRDPAVTGVPFADLTSGYIRGRSTSSPSRGRRTRGAASRTTRATGRAMRRAPIADAALEFARAAPTADTTAQSAA